MQIPQANRTSYQRYLCSALRDELTPEEHPLSCGFQWQHPTIVLRERRNEELRNGFRKHYSCTFVEKSRIISVNKLEGRNDQNTRIPLLQFIPSFYLS